MVAIALIGNAVKICGSPLYCKNDEYSLYVTVRDTGWEGGYKDEFKPGDQPSVVYVRSFGGGSCVASVCTDLLSQCSSPL